MRKNSEIVSAKAHEVRAAIFAPIEVILVSPHCVREPKKADKACGFNFLELAGKKTKLHDIRKDRDNVPSVKRTGGGRTTRGTSDRIDSVGPFVDGGGPELGRSSGAKVDPKVNMSVEDLKVRPIGNSSGNLLAD